MNDDIADDLELTLQVKCYILNFLLNEKKIQVNLRRSVPLRGQRGTLFNCPRYYYLNIDLLVECLPHSRSVISTLCCVSGLSCRELLQKFQHKLIILFKLMMLERRVSCFYLFYLIFIIVLVAELCFATFNDLMLVFMSVVDN